MSNPKSILVIGKRWFQRRYGNTYFSAEIFVDHVLVHKIDFRYGYDDQYLWEAFEWLHQEGYIPAQKDSAARPPPWLICEEIDCKLIYRAIDVERKKDL